MKQEPSSCAFNVIRPWIKVVRRRWCWMLMLSMSLYTSLYISRTRASLDCNKMMSTMAIECSELPERSVVRTWVSAMVTDLNKSWVITRWKTCESQVREAYSSKPVLRMSSMNCCWKHQHTQYVDNQLGHETNLTLTLTLSTEFVLVRWGHHKTVKCKWAKFSYLLCFILVLPKSAARRQWFSKLSWWQTTYQELKLRQTKVLIHGH